MQKNEWVTCDAKRTSKCAVVAVIHFSDGKLVNTITSLVEAESSSVAESQAILLAKELYPGVPIFNDCLGECVKHGVKWIPRKQNQHAHRAASLAYRNASPAEVVPKVKKRKIPKLGMRQRSRRGMGVLVSGERSRFVKEISTQV